MKTLWGQVPGILLARLIQLRVLNFYSSVPLSHMADLKGEAVCEHLRVFSSPPEETSLASWSLILKRVPPISVKNTPVT